MSDSSQNAVVYVASKERYVTEAMTSVASLRQNGGNLHVYLKTTRALATDDASSKFDQILELENPIGSFIDKTSFLEGISHERVMFLDGDTYVCGDLAPGFELLDRFDLAVALAPDRFGGAQGRPPLLGSNNSPIASAFYEFNTGVIFARNSEKVRSAFRKWPNYQQAIDRHDQPSFTRLLWETDLSFFVLPPEYNARVTAPIFLGEPAKIVHARLKNMEAAADVLNRSNGPRVFTPDDLI